MIFITLDLRSDGTVSASAKGHPTDVMTEFHDVCQLLLGGRGQWRITEAHGVCENDTFYDSDMKWALVASLKTQRTG